MVLNGEEDLECEVNVDGVQLEHVSELKYLGCVLKEPGTDETESRRKVVSERRLARTIRSLVNARDLQLECVRVLHKILFVPGSKTMLWKEERSRIWAVQIENLRGLLGIRKMDRVPNAWMRELCSDEGG